VWRNTQNEKIIKENELSDKHKLIYKKRFKIESFFSWVKNYPTINQNYQKKVESYKGLLSLMCSLIISKRI
jgi:transposase